jgi:hypothetical protein
VTGVVNCRTFLKNKSITKITKLEQLFFNYRGWGRTFIKKNQSITKARTIMLQLPGVLSIDPHSLTINQSLKIEQLFLFLFFQKMRSLTINQSLKFEHLFSDYRRVLSIKGDSLTINLSLKIEKLLSNYWQMLSIVGNSLTINQSPKSKQLFSNFRRVLTIAKHSFTINLSLKLRKLFFNYQRLYRVVN